jgi:1-deoxy-D-xylulose-5-phosphate reductoisomerase
MKKKVIILGSTGAIGKITFDIFKKDHKTFKVELLSTNTKVKKIFNQAKLLKVKNVIITDYNSYIKALKKYKKFNINIFNSFSIIDKIFKKKEIFYSMVCIVGIDGLDPILRLIRLSKNIAIINKESLICGWNLIKKQLILHKTVFIPVDSEHFSIFSLLDRLNSNLIEKIFLTASGGPFLKKKLSTFNSIKKKDALRHPNWKMGNKITIDSSTMMNKVFEVIEARHIFNVEYKKIKILIHPKSYVHAIVKFNNGLTKILIHDSNMFIPIYNSIYFSKKKIKKKTNLNFDIINNLELKNIDSKRFPLSNIIKYLPNRESLYETVLVTINDFYVTKFLNNKINYNNMINSIYLNSTKKIFLDYRLKIPSNINEIQKTINYVRSKLIKSSI